MSDWYILDDEKNPVLCEDHVKRSEWLASVPEAERTGIGQIVAKWKSPNDDDVSISTVFLSLDHSSVGGPPMVFESMIFGGERDQDCVRYATWDEAVAGHVRLANELKRQYA